MRHALFDWRLSFRSLLRSPGYSLASVLVLGLGIGVSVAALAIARQALLAPLPYARSDRLVLLFEATPSGSLRLPSNPVVDDWRSQSKRFEGIEYVTGTQALLRETTGPELVTLAVPTLVCAALWETYVWPYLLRAVSPIA